MKILYYTWNETMAYDIEETLDIEGHDVVKVSYPISSYVAVSYTHLTLPTN